MKKLLQGVLVILGFLLATSNGKTERLLKNGNFAERLSKKLGYDNDLGHKKNLILLGVKKGKPDNVDNNGNLAELILKQSGYNLGHKKNFILLGVEKEKSKNLDNNENLAELILKKSGYNNDLEHKKNSIIVVVAKEKANVDSNNGNLAEILLKKSRYHKDLEQKKNLIHVSKEKPNTINNMIKPGNIVILKDNAVYVYNQESGGFIGRSIGSFLSKMLGSFGINDRGGLLSVDSSSINLVHEPLINNTFPGLFVGENINKLKF